MSDTQSFPEKLFADGYTDLIPVIPPGAQLSPTSKIDPRMVGKIPGKRNNNGTWGGFDWRKLATTHEDVRGWVTRDHASIGLRADRFPGVDIDCTDEKLAALISNEAQNWLGVAPIRIGRAPKQLLMYRASVPFGRMRLWIRTPHGEHLVEVLGSGQQYLVHGLHPATGLPYRWLDGKMPPPAADLCEITKEMVSVFLDNLARNIELLDIGFCEREADGRTQADRSDVAQDRLLAPSLADLVEAVECIPNTNDLFPSRTDYLRMGYAIKAAAGPDNDSEGYEIFGQWAMKWEGNGRTKGNDPETVLADWRRMSGAKEVGWPLIAEIARGFGYNDAANDFEVIAGAPEEEHEKPIVAPTLSDQWLADEVIRRQISRLRYVPERECWLVWDRGRWKIDASLLAESLIVQSLRAISDMVLRQGTTPQQIQQSMKDAKIICSAGKASSVMTLMRSDRSIAVSVETLDRDPMVLNTPNGIVDLVSGKLVPPDPAALCTKSTTVVPDFSGGCPVWTKFLDEATSGNKALAEYLQRLAGYCLTGLTREQQLTFIWGDGKNGKSVFLNVLQGIMGEYAKNAPMDAFTASNSDKHTTDIAGLHGARLVTASETTLGKRWDEARVKNLTGGEPVTARFMRQDNFTYIPAFKLVFIGNFKPELRDVGPAMHRRMQLVPFVCKPKVEDRLLGEKLRAEWPAILAWMIRGSLLWQQQGLNPPEVVKVSTDDYLAGEDTLGAWVKECIEELPGNVETTEKLYQSYREWAGRGGEWCSSRKRLAQALIARGWLQGKTRKERLAGFTGVKLVARDPLEDFSNG